MWFSLLSCNECSANALLVRLSRAPAWVVLCFSFSSSNTMGPRAPVAASPPSRCSVSPLQMCPSKSCLVCPELRSIVDVGLWFPRIRLRAKALPLNQELPVTWRASVGQDGFNFVFLVLGFDVDHL